MTASHVVRRFFGLFASTNPFSVPEGALENADNCVIHSPEILEPRRGYSQLAALAGGGQADSLLVYGGTPVAVSHDGVVAGGAVSVYRDSAWSAPAKFSALAVAPPDGCARMSWFRANKAIYLQGRYGLLRLDGLVTGLAQADVLRPAFTPPNWTQPWSPTLTLSLGTYASPQGVIGSGWLANNQQVAYRLTVCRLGGNGELVESAPSERFLCANTSGGNVCPRVAIVDGFMVPGKSAAKGASATSLGVPTDVFYRIYRSKAVPVGTDPSDEMFLVTEAVPEGNNGPIDAGNYFATGAGLTAAVVDRTPDTSLYVPLYTNPYSGEGITQAADGAPVAQDVFWFKNRAHALNTRDVHSLLLKLIGTGTGGVTAGATITVNGVTFTFVASYTGNPLEVPVYTAGTVAQNLENTARQLVSQINAYFATATYGTRPLEQQVIATYLSGSSVDAGQILLRRAVPGASAFTVQTSVRDGWGSDYTTATSSSDNAQAAGWYWSKLDEPEAWPVANSAIIGDAGSAALRGVVLRDAAFVLKRDGVYRITDDGFEPSVSLFNPTARCIAAWTAAAVDDNVLALCDQGVLQINEMGVTNLSHGRIERELLTLIATVGQDTVAKVAFAVSRENEHEYILCLPEAPGATSCTVQYVYNLQTGAWTRWRLPGVVSGAVDQDTGELYWGLASGQSISAYSSAVWRERRTLSFLDYQDPPVSVTCPASTATASLVFAGDQSALFAVGDLVQQAQTTYFLQQRVTAVKYSSGTDQTSVTLAAAPSTPWLSGQAMTVVKAVQARARLLPVHGDEPAAAKGWGDAYAVFSYCDLEAFQATWSSDMYPADVGAEVNPIADGVFGAQAWGGTWGRQTRNVIMKLTLPNRFASSTLLQLDLQLPCAQTSFQLAALDFKLVGVSQKAVR